MCETALWLHPERKKHDQLQILKCKYKNGLPYDFYTINHYNEKQEIVHVFAIRTKSKIVKRNEPVFSIS